MPTQSDYFEIASVSTSHTPLTHYVRVERPDHSTIIEKREGRPARVSMDTTNYLALQDIDSAIAMLMNIRRQLESGGSEHEAPNWSWMGNDKE